METVRAEMSELESGLTDLKNTAYENVNAKLQVFEDEFFADLKERQTSMEQRLVDWQAAFQKELDDAVSEGRVERETAEASYSKELKAQLERLRGTTYGTYEKIQEDVVEFQKGIELRVADSRELLAGLERQIEDEIQQLAAEARLGARTDFAEHREQMAAELRELDRSTRQQIEALGKQFAADRAELESVVDSARGDAAGWKSQIEQRLQTTTGEVNQQIADFRVYMGETITDLRESFESERDQALADRDAERERVQKELDDLGTHVMKITDDIRARSGEAIREFELTFERMKKETEQRVEAAETDLDARVREFRTVVQDSRDQFTAMQERLLGRLNEEASSLGSNLQEIERQQKNFVEQTKIFERADSLKLALTEELSSLKDDLDRVEAQRKDLKDLESQFARLRKSADEVGDKMGRFVAEKRRIDALEGDYKRLLTMSQAVEIKLEHVTASNDSLQAMQASLRSLEQLEKDVETRFQRLEKKRSILDLTTEGVDKNFQNLQEIETRLGEIGNQLGSVPGKIEELGIRLAQLANNKRDADAAVKQLALLDNTLEDIEERMEQLTQAREWLARTETRLEEVQREAEEQVKLLGALMRQDGGASKGADGAPPVTTRDTVIKLARQSWKVDEIARATSLSRGEVELILELSAK
jgi:DNA repair exonuclease SbcCD ATPase subunit